MIFLLFYWQIYHLFINEVFFWILKIEDFLSVTKMFQGKWNTLSYSCVIIQGGKYYSRSIYEGECNYIDRRMATGWLKYCGNTPPPPPTPGGPRSIHVLRDRNFVINNHCTINYLYCFAYFVYYRGKPACYLNKYGVKEGWLGKMLPQNYTSTEQWLIRIDVQTWKNEDPPRPVLHNIIGPLVESRIQ